MINIAYIVSTLAQCGPINQLSYIIKYLDKSTFKPIIITLSPEGEDSLKYVFEEMNIDLISLNLSRFKGIFYSNNKILDVLEKYNVDIVHTQGIRADILSGKYLEKYKTVATLRNYPYYDYTMTYGKIKGWLMAINHLKYLKRIYSPYACSKSVSNILKEKRSYSIKYIQNGVDIEKYYKVETSYKTLLKQKLGLPLDKKVFISVGTLTERKDPFTIIEAFKNKEDIILVFLGDGNLKNECIKRCEKRKNIIFKGNVSNVDEYLKASNFFISASIAEGLPNTVMEAMACGLPCILSDIDPHKEILNYDNRAGYIFSIGDKAKLKRLIDEVLIKDYNQISEYAKELIENNLSAQIMCKNYENEYIKINNSY